MGTLTPDQRSSLIHTMHIQDKKPPTGCSRVVRRLMLELKATSFTQPRGLQRSQINKNFSRTDSQIRPPTEVRTTSSYASFVLRPLVKPYWSSDRSAPTMFQSKNSVKYLVDSNHGDFYRTTPAGVKLFKFQLYPVRFKMLGQIQNLCSKCMQNFQKPQQCGMSTLKHLKLRIGSVKNIKQITSSMKMVSAAKVSRAEKELRVARPLGRATHYFYKINEIEAIPHKPLKILIAITSDKGLCGAVHGHVCRRVRFEIENAKKAENFKIICVGDKAVQLLHHHATNIFMSVHEVGRKSPTFVDAIRIAIGLLQSGYNFDSVKIIFNRMNTIMSYTTIDLSLFSIEAIKASPNIFKYDGVDTDVLQSYLEFSLAALIFYALKENITAEHGSRMTTMDQATNNAKTMLTDLNVVYNRSRQASITKDLMEIIAGASAL